MRQPLDGTITVTGQFREPAQPGTGLSDGKIKRHIGVDLRAKVGTRLYAPGDGMVTNRYSGAGGNTLEARIAGKLWRFMHLSNFNVANGQIFKEGTLLGYTGNSGGVAPHLHVDVRNDNTAWNKGLDNFYNYQDVINAANSPAKASPAAPTGKRVYFTVGQTATFFKVSGGTFKMYIKDSSYNWSVLKEEPGRVLVHSASAGDHCWVYTKYSNTGNVIPGRWVK